MSGFISEPVETDEQAEHATSEHGAPTYHIGQRHDRLRTMGGEDENSVTMNTKDNGEDGVDISAGQKMLSAVSGSLLTSLLGMAVLTLNRAGVLTASQQSHPLTLSVFDFNLNLLPRGYLSSLPHSL